MIFLSRLSRFIRVFLLVFLLFLAALLGAARLLLPAVGDYRAEIISSISASIGNPIEIDSLSAGLNGFRPEVVLSEVKIIDPTGRDVLLRFDQLRAGLNLKELLLTGNFQPRWVTIRGARLSIQRRKDGGIRVVGIDSGGDMPKWVFDEGYFELLDSEVDWQDLKHSAAHLHFSSTDIRLLNEDNRHKVAINVDLPAVYGTSLSLRLDYQGDLFLPECCNGRMYIRGSDVHYGKLMQGLSFDGYSILQGRGDFRLWSSWEKSAIVDLAGEVDFGNGNLSHRNIEANAAEGILALRKMAGWFRWTRNEQNWNLWGRHWLLDVAGEPWPLTDFRLKRTVDLSNGASDIHFESSYLKLDDLKLLLMDLHVLAPDDRQKLEKSAPRGEIFDLNLGLSRIEGKARDWSVCGRFKKIGFHPRKLYPGVKNLSGKICGNQDKGWFQLNASQAEIGLPEVFRIPIGLKTLQGDFRWSREHQVWKIESDRMIAVNPVLTTESRILLKVPLAEGEPFLDVQVAFENGSAAEVHRYLPVSILQKPLIEWLDAAFLSGTVTRGGALFRGPIFAFPFRGSEGVFETLFHTKDVDVSYHPDWPVLNTDESEVRFFQAGMSVYGEHGRILGAQVGNVRVAAADFEFDDYLMVTGTATGRIRQSIDFIKNSPLAPLYEPLLKYVAIRGDNRIGLKLKVPITTGLDDVFVKGTIGLKKTQVSAFGLKMEQVRGNLNFTQDRIYGEEIEGEFLDSSVRVDMSDNNRGQALQIRGSFDMDALTRNYPTRLWKYFSGSAGYQIDVQIPKLREELYADIGFHSDLIGVNVGLPPPLAKPAAVRRNLYIKMHLEPGGEVPIDLVYGDIAKAYVNLSEKDSGFELGHGQIELGHTSGEKRMARGLNLYASLDSLALSPWRTFLTSLYSSGNSKTVVLNTIDIQADKWMLSGVDAGPFMLKMHRNGDHWEGVTESTFASGEFSGKNIGKSASGIDLNFKYLRIPKQNVLVNNPSTEKFHWNPGNIPNLKLRADRFFWKAIDYGALELTTSQQARGMKIDRLNIHGNGLNLNLTGYWMASESGDRTFISGGMEIDDLGGFLARMGKSNVIKGTRVSSKVNMKWSDPLYDLNVETLSGTAQVELGQGRLLTVEPGIGRLFGLFNLDGLKNLLMLDFGQLFGQGLAYEGVKSSFHLTDGRAKIARLIVDAVPAEIIVSGNIDLASEELDDVVTVVPKGVVAAGASMILTQELPGSAVDGLINRQYRVTGKWDNPKIVRLPGSGKPL